MLIILKPNKIEISFVSIHFNLHCLQNFSNVYVAIDLEIVNLYPGRLKCKFIKSEKLKIP